MGARKHRFDVFRLRLRVADLAATGQSLSVRRSRRQVYSGDASRRKQSLHSKARSVGISCFCTACSQATP